MENLNFEQEMFDELERISEVTSGKIKKMEKVLSSEPFDPKSKKRIQTAINRLKEIPFMLMLIKENAELRKENDELKLNNL